MCALLLHGCCGSVSSQSEPDGRLGSFVPDDRDLSQFWVSFIVFAELNGWRLATYSLVSPDVLHNYFSSYSREGGRKGLKSNAHWIRQQKKTGIGCKHCFLHGLVSPVDVASVRECGLHT